MSITLYREGLPRIEINSPAIDGREGMLVGFHDTGTVAGALVMLEDGRLSYAALSDFRIQMHYDPEANEWVDENDRQTDRE